MKLKHIMKVLTAEAIGTTDEDLDIKMGGAADLLSDVLVHTKPGGILLTGLTNIQVIYTASVAGTKAICFVRGKRPPKETIELAVKKNIALIATKLHMFESCGKLYKEGLVGSRKFEGASEK